MANNILDVPLDQFMAMLPELAQQGVDTDNLLRMYRSQNSPLAGVNAAADSARQEADAGGRRSIVGGLFTKEEGTTGMDAVRSVRPSLTAGLLGALSGAGQAVDAPAAAAQGLIPQGDMALEALGTAGAAMTGGGAAAGRGVLDYDPNTARIFAGPKAKTADMGAMAQAQEMAARGASRDDIWRDTGWFTGADGKWRFEIDDSGAFPFVNSRDGQLMAGSGRFGDVIDHSNLNAAYPDVSDIDTIYQNSPQRSGQYQPFEDRSAYDLMDLQEEIGIRDTTPRGLLQTGLHEGQHAVQRREGFATGGNAMLGRELSQEPLLGEVQGLQDYIRNTERAIASSADPNGPFEMSLREGLDGAKQELANIMPYLEKRPRTAYDAYLRIAGEAEARNVETRADMTPAQRRATPPWATLDVPENELIPLGATKNQSINLTPSQQMARRILDMRAAGRAGEVTDDMMAQADPQVMFNETPLPMDAASRAARARDAGFGTGRNRMDPIAEMRGEQNPQLVHYTNKDFPAFEIPEAQNRQAVWATPDPDLNLATKSNWRSFDEEGVNGIPIVARMNNRVSPLEFREAGDPMTPAFPSNITAQDVAKANSVGADHASAGMEYAIFDPRNIRSQFARFDPEFAHLSNLSAANVSPTAGSLAAMGADEDRKREIVNGLMPSAQNIRSRNGKLPRNGSGVYSLPGGSTVTNGDTSDATDINTPLEDLVTDANTARPIVAGGTGATSASAALVNLGLTATAAEINTLDGITASTAELNILDGVTATTAELNYTDGVTSNIQTQLDDKGPALDGSAAISTASGTTKTQAIPAAVQEVVVILNGVGVNTAPGTLILQLGTSSALVTSGYQSGIAKIDGSPIIEEIETGITLGQLGSFLASGTVTLTRLVAGSNLWEATVNVRQWDTAFGYNVSQVVTGGGYISLAGELDLIALSAPTLTTANFTFAGASHI